jgi:hypothetical protein
MATETGIAPINFHGSPNFRQPAPRAGGNIQGHLRHPLRDRADKDGKAYVGWQPSGALIDSIDLNDPSFNGVLLERGGECGEADGRLVSAQKSVYIHNDICTSGPGLNER